MISENLRERLAKLYTMAQHGGTDGEKQAAKLAIDKLLNKYNIDEAELDSINKKRYWFKYRTMLDIKLFTLICNQCIDVAPYYGQSKSNKTISIQLTYEQYITVDCMYGYFKAHMRKEWLKVASPIINKCRKTKTKNEMRQSLMHQFFSTYIRKSSLYRPQDFTRVKSTSIESARQEHFEKIEGGNFNKQIITHNQITN